jgi:hypothetical protein
LLAFIFVVIHYLIYTMETSNKDLSISTLIDSIVLGLVSGIAYSVIISEFYRLPFFILVIPPIVAIVFCLYIGTIILMSFNNSNFTKGFLLKIYQPFIKIYNFFHGYWKHISRGIDVSPETFGSKIGSIIGLRHGWIIGIPLGMHISFMAVSMLQSNMKIALFKTEAPIFVLGGLIGILWSMELGRLLGLIIGISHIDSETNIEKLIRNLTIFAVVIFIITLLFPKKSLYEGSGYIILFFILSLARLTFYFTYIASIIFGTLSFIGGLIFSFHGIFFSDRWNEKFIGSFSDISDFGLGIILIVIAFILLNVARFMGRTKYIKRYFDIENKIKRKIKLL